MTDHSRPGPAAQPGEPRADLRPRRARLWTVPALLLLALVTYHVWELYLRPAGTGLSVRLVDLDEARRELGANDRAIVLDVRLHAVSSPFDRTLRIPHTELDRRMQELAPHRGAPVYVLAATEEEAAATAAELARRNFESVACIRMPPTAHARAESPVEPVD